MQKIYMIESTPVITKRFFKGLSGMYEIRICAHIENALDEIRTFQPDLLIVDMTDPFVADQKIPERVRLLGLHCKLIVSTPFICGALEKRMLNFGCDVLLPRPFTVEYLMQLSVELLLEKDHSAQGQLRRLVNEMLLFLGLRVDLHGYGYVLEAVTYAATHMDCLISCEIYPYVAKLYSGNAKQTERVMRNCIEEAWKNRDDRIWNMYFPKDSDGKTRHVSNGAFIKRIAFAVTQVQFSGDIQIAE